MLSMEVSDREYSARAVVRVLETHAGALTEAHRARVAPLLAAGEVAPDVGLALRLQGRRLAAACDAMVAADLAHEQELGDDEAPRRRRDESWRALHDACVDARDAVETVLGDEALAPVGMAKPAPQDPVALVAWAGEAVARLRDAGVVLPAPRRKGSVIDRDALADEVGALVPTLAEALDDVARERREAEATHLAKMRAILAYDTVFGEVAALAAAQLRAAGLTELAERVRPSARRPGRTELALSSQALA